ncbi:hypothetical protein D3C84_815390 [compost metagenome]
MALGVIGWAVVDSHQWCLQCREHQLAGAPGILKSTSGPSVIEAVKRECAWPIIIKNLLGHPSIKRQRIIPAGVHPLVSNINAWTAQPLLAYAVGAVHDLG